VMILHEMNTTLWLKYVIRLLANNHLEDGEKRNQAIGGKGMEYKTNQYMIYALNKMGCTPK
jgi:hypothetical protein